jgi:hypothetical protein
MLVGIVDDEAAKSGGVHSHLSDDEAVAKMGHPIFVARLLGVDSGG